MMSNKYRREFYDASAVRRNFTSTNNNNNGPRYHNQRQRGGYRNRQSWNDHDDRHYRGHYRQERPSGSGGFNSFDDHSRDNRGRRQAAYDQMRGRRHRYKLDNRNDRNKKNSLGWHKIIIHDGGHYNKDEVLRVIKDVVEEPFTPIMFEPEGNHLVFFLENNGQAVEAIEKVSKRLWIHNSNNKLFIRTNQSAPPIRKLTPEQMMVVKQVMSDRYSVQMSRLDLCNLHNDPKLTSQNIFCPLNRSPNMQLVTGLILEHIKGVTEIDLGFNKIFSLDDLTVLSTSCPNLTRLSLEKNKIPKIDALDKLKGLQITELTLKDNPLCDKFRDTESYISAVRQRFPKVLYLDGQELPKPVVFELEDEPSKLPEIKGSYFCSEEAKKIVSEFILQYYQIFDSNNRKPLDAAYSEDAVLSLSVSFPDNGPGSKYIQQYLQENRNHLRISDSDRRQEKLFRGRSKIAEILCKLPGSTHDPMSFVIDIPFAEPQLVLVVLTGVFRQVADRTPPIRSFMRTFSIVPVGSGFCISNELLCITNATIEQVKKSFKTQQPAAPPSQELTPVAAIPPMPNVNEDQMKMIQEFSAQSGMLPVYCGMCLEQNNWDCAKAGEMFLNLKAENKIPPEYYPSS